jgi:hypothetical protein
MNKKQAAGQAALFRNQLSVTAIIANMALVLRMQVVQIQKSFIVKRWMAFLSKMPGASLAYQITTI